MINRLSPIYVLPLLGLGVLLGCGQESLSTPETSNPIPATNVNTTTDASKRTQTLEDLTIVLPPQL